MKSAQGSSPGRLHGLDTLRAAAILAVVPYHFGVLGLLPAALAPMKAMGWAGVDLFFVLSGYLIGSQLLKPYTDGKRLSLREFYARRAYRILPAFFVVLLLYICVPSWREAPGPYAPWQYATFTWNLLLLGYPAHRAFSHVWSLCVEEHFYLVLPVLILFLMRRPSARTACALVGALLAGGMGLRWWLLHHVVLAAAEDQQLNVMMHCIYYPTYARLDGLVMGVGLAAVRTFRAAWWQRMTGHGHAALLLGIACVAAALAMCGFDYPSPARPASVVLAFPTISLGFSLLVVAALSTHGLLRRKIPGAGAVASLAFSLYLTHKAVAHGTHRFLPNLTAEADWSSFAIYLAACFAVAAALFLGVERPFLALRARREKPALANSVVNGVVDSVVDGVVDNVEREIKMDPAI